MMMQQLMVIVTAILFVPAGIQHPLMVMHSVVRAPRPELKFGFRDRYPKSVITIITIIAIVATITFVVAI